MCISHDQNKEQNCSNGVCYFRYSTIENSIDGGCFQNSNIWMKLSLKSFITTEEDIYEEQNEESQSILQIAILEMTIEYECQGNKCNNQAIAKLVIKAVKDHYDLSKVYEVLNVKIEENSESTIISTEIDTTSPIPRSTTTKKPDTTTITKYGITTTKTNSTTALIITTTEQQSNIATSLHISIIMTIISSLLFSYF